MDGAGHCYLLVALVTWTQSQSFNQRRITPPFKESGSFWWERPVGVKVPEHTTKAVEEAPAAPTKEELKEGLVLTTTLILSIIFKLLCNTLI